MIKQQKPQRDKIDELIHRPPNFVFEGLQQLRYLILTEGLSVNSQGECHYRNYVWTILLQIDMGASDYPQLISRGPSAADQKIRNDTFRTLATDRAFKAKVSENALSRILNAYAWSMGSAGNANIGSNGSRVGSRTGSRSLGPRMHSVRDFKKNAGEDLDWGGQKSGPGYVQGMNVLAAPFLYVSRSETQAFAMFSKFITCYCPTYVTPTLVGVHNALELVDLVLELADKNLYTHLKGQMLAANLYAFAPIMTFSAGIRPLTEALKLWDVIMAYGAHLNVLFVVSQVLMMRQKLLKADRPMSLLRSFPSLVAKDVVTTSLGLLRKLPRELHDLLVVHGTDLDCGEQIAKYRRAKGSK